MKPPTALADKGKAVEEWIDLHFFRPAGAGIARALLPTSVSPDAVTVVAIVIGVAAGHLFFYNSPRLNALGLLLFVVSDIFDSADGQLARMRGTSTRRGRILDGVGDNIRFANLYAHLLARLLVAGGAWGAVILAVCAAISHSLQSTAIDFIRNAYLAVVVGKGELDLPEDLADEPAEANPLVRVAVRLHRNYVERQAHLAPRSVHLIRAMRGDARAAAVRAEYGDRQASLLRHCGWLGQNIRFLVVGIAGIAGYPAAFLWAEVTVMNLIVIVLLAAHERNSAEVVSALEAEAQSYAGAN